MMFSKFGTPKQRPAILSDLRQIVGHFLLVFVVVAAPVTLRLEGVPLGTNEAHADLGKCEAAHPAVPSLSLGYLELGVIAKGAYDCGANALQGAWENIKTAGGLTSAATGVASCAMHPRSCVSSAVSAGRSSINFITSLATNLKQTLSQIPIKDSIMLLCKILGSMGPTLLAAALMPAIAGVAAVAKVATLVKSVGLIAKFIGLIEKVKVPLDTILELPVQKMNEVFGALTKVPKGTVCPTT